VIHNTALNSLILFTLILQTIITAQVTSIGGEGLRGYPTCKNTITSSS